MGVVILASAVGQVAGQSSGQSSGRALAQAVEATRFPVGWASPQPQEVPRDVRIMQTIVRTALSEVEAPELPRELAGDTAAVRDVGGARALSGALGDYVYSMGTSFSGRGDVSGFYMEGYGYLFTVRWPVSSAALYTTLLAAEQGRAVGLTGQEAPSGAGASWADEYRQRLSDALRDAIAGYGSTLRRAGPGESITFIADFGGGDAETVTMTVRADALQGSDLEANRAAIRVSSGQSGVSSRLRSQLTIMSQIIDTSLRSDVALGGLYADAWSAYVGGTADAQYVPGYGVIFRKTARMSTARTFSGFSGASPRESADSLEQSARATYREHLDTLRRKTVEVLAVYGPTLTELEDDDWVGIYYDVGSAAALLNEGMDDYLVQARMRDIRQAAAQSDPEAWLEQRVVTNERGE